MTRRYLMTLRLLMLLGDGIVAALVFLIVSAVRFEEGNPNAVWSVGVDIPVAAAVFASTWVVVLWSLGLYRLGARWSLLAEARDLGRSTLVVLALTLSILFLLHQDNVSRLFLAMLFIAQPAASLGLRALARHWFDSGRRRGRNPTFMVVVGTGPLARGFAEHLTNRRDLGVQVVGHLLVPEEVNDQSGGSPSAPVLGDIEALPSLFKTRVVDEIAICLPESAVQYLEPLIALAGEEGKTVRVPSRIEESVLSGALNEEMDGFLVRSVIHDGHRDLELAMKRVLDVMGAVAAIVLFSPIMAAAAVLIRIRDGSPVIFRQTRVGRHGRPFTIYKFRTMVSDAEEWHADLEQRSDTAGAAFKLREDPRVTPTGRFLRATSIDELPQLFNVLKGEMSLVGPRPAPPREVDRYDVWHRRRLSMRPGITGLWQIHSRIDEHFDDRAELDLRYIDQWSLLMDLGILARTLPAVLTRSGH